jgi:hypothetical protein
VKITNLTGGPAPVDHDPLLEAELVDAGDSSRAAWARTEFAISVPRVQA